MRIVSYLDAARHSYRLGVDTGEGIAPSDIGTLRELLADQDAGIEHLQTQVRRGARLSDVRLGAPTTQPGKMLFCGLNYEDHLQEIPSMSRPTSPFFFAKLPSSITGPNDDVSIPDAAMDVDYEAELAIVIGREARGVRTADALEYVFGFTAVNDLTARNIQFADQQLTLGKGIDGFCPMGPAIVLRDDVDFANLRITCTVNGVTKQEGNTRFMIASVPELVSYVSRWVTLFPGDIIATGTPAGVGYAKSPPQYLKAGDVVSVDIESLGSLRNTLILG